MFFIIFSFFKYLILCLQLYLYFFIRKERFQRKSFLAGSSIKRNSSSLRQQTNNGSLCLGSDYKECIVLFCNQLGPNFYGDQLVPVSLQSTGPNFLSQSTGSNFYNQLVPIFCKQCSVSFHFHCLPSEFTKDVLSIWKTTFLNEHSIRPHFYCTAKDVQ